MAHMLVEGCCPCCARLGESNHPRAQRAVGLRVHVVAGSAARGGLLAHLSARWYGACETPRCAFPFAHCLLLSCAWRWVRSSDSTVVTDPAPTIPRLTAPSTHRRPPLPLSWTLPSVFQLLPHLSGLPPHGCWRASRTSLRPRVAHEPFSCTSPTATTPRVLHAHPSPKPPSAFAVTSYQQTIESMPITDPVCCRSATHALSAVAACDIAHAAPCPAKA